VSFDCIGPLTKTSEDSKLVFDVIKGQDNFDQTTIEEKPSRQRKGIIGIVDLRGICDENIANLFNEKVEETAKKNNWELKKINLPLDIALEAYYIIVYTEFFSTTRKFDGRRFGKKIEEFAGPEVIRRIIGGSEITKAEHDGKYYKDALKARNYIKSELQKIFQVVDAILLPTTPKTPHKIGEKISVEDMYAYDIFTTPSSITGIPTISIPLGKIDEKDVGLQILAPNFEEDLIFKLAKKFE
jgi:aspartyl-tRNA(Asn)/glutamyl-tRNA(Gln) amidotransferase subunit A